MKYGQAVGKLAAEYQQKEQAAMFQMPRGGAQQALKGKLYLEKLEKMGDAFIDCWLGSFQTERVVPDAGDLKQLHQKIDAMFGGPHASLPHLPLGIHRQIEQVASITHRKLNTRALEMKLQQKSFGAAESKPTYEMKIERNYGAVQQGSGNTQQVQIDQSVESLTRKLVEIIQQSSLQPLVKSEVVGHVYQIQHLETLDQSTTVIQEKRERLLTVDKLLSSTADVYTLAVPAIAALKAMFGS